MSLPPPTNSEINSNNYISSANSIFDDGLDEEYRVFLSQLLSDEIEGDEEGEEGEYQPENKEETLDDDDSESDDDGDEGEDGESVDDEPEDDDNMSGLMRVAKNEVRDLVDECWKTMLGEAPQVPALDASNQSRPYHNHEHTNTHYTNDHPHQPSPDYNYTHHNNTYNNDYIESDILSTSSYDSQDEYQTRNFRTSSTDSHPHDHNTDNIYNTTNNNNSSSQTFANKRKYNKSNKHTRNNKDNTTNNTNNTSYITKIMRQMMSSESKPSDICVDGYPVNAYRRILARQWHMVSQLLLQLLILTQSAVIEDGENEKKGQNYDLCKEFYGRICNNKSKSIKRAALMRMNVENLLLAKGVSTSENLLQYNTPGLQHHATSDGWVPGEPLTYSNPAWDGHTHTQSSPPLYNDNGDNSLFGHNHQNYDPLSSHSPGNSFPHPSHSPHSTYQQHQHNYTSTYTNTDPTTNTSTSDSTSSLHIYDRKLTRLQAIKKQTTRYSNKLSNTTTNDNSNSTNNNNNNTHWQASLDLPILKYNNTNDLLEKIKHTILTCHLDSNNIDNMQTHTNTHTNTHTTANTIHSNKYTLLPSYNTNILNLHKLKHYLTIICTSEQWPIRNCLLPTETYPLSASVVSLYYTNKAASDFSNEFLKSLSALPPLPSLPLLPSLQPWSLPPLPSLSTLPPLPLPPTLLPLSSTSNPSGLAYDDQRQQLSSTCPTSNIDRVDSMNLTSGTGGESAQLSGYTQDVGSMFAAAPELTGYPSLASYPAFDLSYTDPLALSLPSLATYSSLLPFGSQPDYTTYMNAFMNPALYSSTPLDPATYTPLAPTEALPSYPTTTTTADTTTTTTTGDTRYACALGFGDNGTTDLTPQPTAVIPWLQSYTSAVPFLSSLTGAYDFDMMYFTPAEEVRYIRYLCVYMPYSSISTSYAI